MKSETVRKNINTGEWEHYVSTSTNDSHWSPGLTSNSSLISTKQVDEVQLYDLNGNIQIYEDIVYSYISFPVLTYESLSFTSTDSQILNLNQKTRKLNDAINKENETIQNLTDLTESEGEDFLQVEGLLL